MEVELPVQVMLDVQDLQNMAESDGAMALVEGEDEWPNVEIYLSQTAKGMIRDD